MADHSNDLAGSGWSMFAGVWLAVAGLFNAIDGLVALLNKEYFNEAALVYDNLQAWGWAFLIIGVIQGFAGWLGDRPQHARPLARPLHSRDHHGGGLLRDRRLHVVEPSHRRRRRGRHLGPHGALGAVNEG